MSDPRAISFFPHFIRNFRQGFIVLLLVEQGFANSWYCIVTIPIVKFGKTTESEWYSDEVHHSFSLSLPTEVKFDKSPYFWYFTGKLLGFGASVSHQYGY